MFKKHVLRIIWLQKLYIYGWKLWLYCLALVFILWGCIIIFGKHVCVGAYEFLKNVITLAVNNIVLWILDSEKVKEQTFLDVIALYLNVILICILNSEGTTSFGCNRTSCKRYYNLVYFRQCKSWYLLNFISKYN